MGIPVKLEVFEGPLDLLLHLIDKNKIDIYDIPIVMITNQYMEYIQAMEKKDLNIMSEFLLMAATLLDIKCRMLLPKEVNEDGEEEDPREVLVAQLLEYKMYKYMSYELRDLEKDGLYSYYKNPTIPDEVALYQEPVDLDMLLDGIDMGRLEQVFKEVMKRVDDKVDQVRSNFGKIEKEEVTVKDKITYVEGYIISHKKCNFRELLMTQNSTMHVVVTFLAILELMKVGKIEILQEDLFEDIWITAKDVEEKVDIQLDEGV